jgi:hypothetical protein
MRTLDLRFSAVVCASVLAGVQLGIPQDASACGGCFGPVGSPTVVTRHQMAVAISTTQTTLWDQIEYAGNPEDFVWVLPVRGGVPVELAENAFFEAIEQATTISMTVPPVRTFCPDPCFGGGFASADRSDEDPGVTIYHQANIGPYQTVTIGSEDPEALVAWLRDNGYTVPDATLPTIAYYTEQNMDFAVLRLAPNAGVNQMQPVRVTMPGFNPTFPLRMVSAGVEGSVGLDLAVFAEGRYEAGNFANAEVDRSRLTYDWNTSTFNYDALYAEAASTEGGRVWVTEYAQPYGNYWIEGYVSYDDAGQPHSASEDWAVVAENITNPYLTRLTADMPAQFLDQDLALVASAGPDLSNFINVANEISRPAEAVCSAVCTDPAGATSTGWRSGARGDGLCSASAGSSGSMFGFAVFGFAMIALGLRRKR